MSTFREVPYRAVPYHTVPYRTAAIPEMLRGVSESKISSRLRYIRDISIMQSR